MRARPHPQLRRLLALGVLFGLSAALGHVHGEHDEDAHEVQVALLEADTAHGAERPRASSDDAHHEHSSTVAVVVELCLGCRTRQDQEHALAARAPAVPAPTGSSRHASTSSAPAVRETSRLPDGRAPPALVG